MRASPMVSAFFQSSYFFFSFWVELRFGYFFSVEHLDHLVEILTTNIATHVAEVAIN